MKMTGSQAVIRALEEEQVTVVFGYPGGAVLPIYDRLGTSSIRHILVRNEQSAVHSASGYARSTGKVGVCMATSGPGATNLVTGIATAYMDSIPIVAITGQVSSDVIGRDVFQEIDITGTTEPFCKHNYLIKDIKDLPRIFKEAFHIASTGRPGPVLIDIPKDIAMATLDFHYPAEVSLKGYKPNYHGHPLQIKRLIKAIEVSDRPLICVGGGVTSSGAEKEVLELVNRTGIPVTTTLMGIGAFPGNHPQALGMLGMLGQEMANRAIEQTDLLIVLGARMGDRATRIREEFGRAAVIAHIDIDPAEIGKNINTDIPIVGDLKKTLKELLEQSFIKRESDWTTFLRTEYMDEAIEEGDPKNISPIKLMEMLSRKANKDTIIVTDVGQHQMWAGKYYKIDQPRSFLTSGGLGTMGYGLPAAIGAKIAHPNREVLLITGDGSIQMNLGELATACQEEAVLKIVLMNNQTLGMVREQQQQMYDSRYFSVRMKGNPDFIKLADAYGIRGIRIQRPDEMEEAIDRLLQSKESFLCECMIDPDENVIPIKGGK